MIRVVVADDHAIVRSGLRMLLDTLADTIVVGEAADGVEAVDRITELRPDVAVMDIAMPGLNGLEAIRRVRIAAPATRVLVLSMHGEESYVKDALAAGASGYLLKGADRAELEKAVRAVAGGDTWITPRVSGKILAALQESGSSDPLGVLTSRQREILQLLAEGLTTRKIAARLAISTKTVEAHRAAIMERLDIHELASLVRFAIRTGLTNAESGPHKT